MDHLNIFFTTFFRKSALVMLAFLQRTSLVVFFIIAWKGSGEEIIPRKKWEYIHYISWFIIRFIFIIKLSILYIVLNCIILSYILTFLDGHIGPQILSQPTEYRVHLGSQLKLSCNVSQLSGNQVTQHQYLSNCWRLR